MKRNTTSKKRWRLEVKNPFTTYDWRPLWEFEEEQRAAYIELIDDLNRINAPVQLRVVECSPVGSGRERSVEKRESIPRPEQRKRKHRQTLLSPV
ncbi:MAG: hypothetical protein WAU45_10445 [Blastocatellia bacterium]